MPYVVLLISVLFFTGAYFIAASNSRTKDELRFKDAAGQAQAALESRIRSQISLLRGAAGFMSVAPKTDRPTFRKFVQRLEIENNQEGVLGVGWTPRVTGAAQQAEFVQKLRASTSRTDVGLSRDGIAFPDAYPVEYVEPFGSDAQKRGLGFDMYSEPKRREAMSKARDQAQPVMTAPITLRQATSTPNPLGFIIYVPVYAGGRIPETAEKRRADIFGFVFSPYRSNDLLDNKFVVPAHGVASELYDSPTDQLLSKSADFPVAASSHAMDSKFEVAGRAFKMRFASTPAFDQGSDTLLVSTVPILGALVSFVLFWLTAAQSRARNDAEGSARELRRAIEGQILLANAGHVLATSLNYRTTLDSVARLLVPGFADWCAIDMLVDGQLQRISVTHREPEKVEWARTLEEKYPVDMNSKTGVPNVLRTGKSELYPVIPEKLLMDAAVDEEHREVIRKVGFTSAIVVPLAARGRILGAISLVVAESGWHYNDEDLALAEQIASRAAIAVDNALLFEEKEKEIDDRQSAEDQVRELNERLEALVEERTRELQAANQELEAFCYSVSHDLRSPLRSVDGFAQALLEDYGQFLDDEGAGFVKRIRAAARRMDELITALLALSRLTRAEIHREPIDLTAIARSAGDDLIREMGAGNVELSIERGLKAVGDSKMARIVFENLIGNAIKFSATRPQPKIEIGSVVRDGKPFFFVRDNGVGFNPQFTNKLFRPFERLHSPAEFPGSGIGLATVQRIVARHGGETFGESSEGKGATFYFSLP